MECLTPTTTTTSHPSPPQPCIKLTDKWREEKRCSKRVSPCGTHSRGWDRRGARKRPCLCHTHSEVSWTSFTHRQHSPTRVTRCVHFAAGSHSSGSSDWLKRCFTSTETVGLLGTGAQDGHPDFHTAPGLYCARLIEVLLDVHINRRFIRDRESRTATPTFTQLLGSVAVPLERGLLYVYYIAPRSFLSAVAYTCRQTLFW